MTTSREKNPPPPTDVRSETSRLSQAALERIFIDGELIFPVSRGGTTMNNNHAHDGIFIDEGLNMGYGTRARCRRNVPEAQILCHSESRPRIRSLFRAWDKRH